MVANKIARKRSRLSAGQHTARQREIAPGHAITTPQFPAAVLDDVAGCLPVIGPAKTEQDIASALKRAAKAA